MIKNIPYFIEEVQNSFQYINSLQETLPAIIIQFMNNYVYHATIIK